MNRGMLRILSNEVANMLVVIVEVSLRLHRFALKKKADGVFINDTSASFIIRITHKRF